MSGTVSTLSSTTKGDPPASIGTKQPTKAGFDHLDVNKLFKGKAAEPTTKLVAQKHGMQTLGKVLPARRAGGPAVSLATGEPSGENASEERKGPPVTGDPSTTFQDPNGQGWTTQQQQQQQQHYPAHTPLAITNQIPIPPLLQEKKWSGGRADGNYPASRFAQEFPTLDAAVGEGSKVPAPPGPPSGHRSQMKSQDNQYGPGPILRPQTEGSWTQGGGGGRRPSPPTQPNFPQERGPMGVPPQMAAIGQIPPPLGAYHPTFRPNQPNMYQKPGGGGYYPGGAGNPRFGMPIPHDAPPPGHSNEPAPPPLRRAGGPPPRPTSHFTSKPIIKQEELERMDEIGTHDGDWASTNDDVDYNKRICFSDEEDHQQSQSKRSPPPLAPQGIPPSRDRPGQEVNKAPIQSHPANTPHTHYQQQLGERSVRMMEEEERPVRMYRDSDEDWRPTRLVDKDMGSRHGPGDRERGGGGRNRGRDDDWRSGPRTSFDDFRGKNSAPPPQQQQQRDTRPPPDFHKPLDKYSSAVPPRFLKHQQQQQQQNPNQPPQRHTPSPNAPTNGNGGKDQAPPTYKLLERKRGESESSRDSNPNQPKDKRKFMNDHTETRGVDRDGKGEEYRKRESQAHPPSSGIVKKEEVEKPRVTSSTSWAEEMDEDESLNAISEIRKSHHKEPSPVLKKEERRDRIESKRLIRHTKVVDMTTVTKQESPPPSSKSSQPQPNSKEGKGGSSNQNQEQLTQSNVSSSSRENEVKGKSNSAWAEMEKNLPRVQSEPQQLMSMGREEEKKDKAHGPLPPDQGKTAKGGGETKHPRLVEREHSKEFQPPPKHHHHVNRDEGTERKEGTLGKEDKKDHLHHHDERRTGDTGDQFYKRGGSKPTPPRKNSRESRHPPNPSAKAAESAGDGNIGRDEPKRVHQTAAQQKSHENLNQHKEQRPMPGGDGKKDEKRGPVPPKHNNQQKPQQQQQVEPKQHQPPPKVDEGKGKNVPDEGRRQEKGQGSVWADKKKVTPRPQQPHQSKEEEEMHEMSQRETKESKGEGHRKQEGEGSDFRRQNKSPLAGKRNDRNGPPAHHGAGGGGRGGGSRLQGYGPPSDRSPFSSNTNKEPEDDRKDKERKEGGGHPSTRLVIPPPTSGPVPLMALGEISPPDMHHRRHLDFGGGRPPRFQKDRGFQQPPPQQQQRGGQQKQSGPNFRGSGKGPKKGSDGDGESQHHSGNWSSKGGGGGKEESANNKPDQQQLGKDSSNLHPSSPAPQPLTTAPPPPDPVPDLSSNKVPTMVFENTKMKLSDITSAPGQGGKMGQPQQQQGMGDERNSPGLIGLGGGTESKGMDLSKQVPLPFPKEPSPSVKLDFGSSFGDHGGSRSYSHPHDPHGHYRGHQRSMSPLQADLPDNLQAIRSIWETPSLPSDHAGGGQSGGPESGLSNSFGQVDNFGGGKESESPLGYTNALDLQRGSDGEKQEGGVPYHLVSIPRNPHQSLSSGGTNGYSAPSVIAKPVSSGSPGLRQQQMKNIQQHSLDSQQQQQQQQPHGPIQFSPFGYGMPQGANAFGPIGGVPSPPSIYAQKSTQLYQQFNHHDNSHVLGGGGGRSHSGYGGYGGVGTGVGGGGNPYPSSLYLQQAFDNYGPYTGHSGPPPPQPTTSLQLQSNNRISPGLPPPTSNSGLPLSSTAPGNNAFKTVRNLNPNSISHPSLHHQNNQQPFSQLTHHLAHPHLTPIGPQKQSPYSQQPLQPQSQQLYIPFDPNQQSLMSLGGNYGGLRSGGGPPPSATPPMPGLSSSSYYAPPNPGVNQGYPQQNPQAGLPVPPPGSNPHYGLQFQPTNMQQFSSQGPTGNVLGNSLVRPQHGNRK